MSDPKYYKSGGGSETMFMVKLAAFACFMSIVVVGVSVFILNMSDKAGRRAEEQTAGIAVISADLPAETSQAESPPDAAGESVAAVVSDPSADVASGSEVSLEDENLNAAEKIIESKSAQRRPKSDAGPDTVVVIDKKDYRLTVVKNGTPVKEYDIAVGKNTGDKERRGDMRTPEGEFKVQQFQNASSWKHDFRDGKGNIKGAYGPLFIRLRTPPWSGIGIHGTHDPESIRSNATEGCVRMKNEELLEFAEMVDVGTRVIIKP